MTSVAVPVLAVLLSQKTLVVRPKAKPPPSAQSKSVQPVLTNLMLAFSSVKYEFLGFVIWVRVRLTEFRGFVIGCLKVGTTYVGKLFNIHPNIYSQDGCPLRKSYHPKTV